VFSGVFITEEDDGVGDTIAVHVQMLLEASWNMSKRSTFLIDEAFIW
jgi:hypothetical protein